MNEDQMNALIDAIRAIAHGPTSGATGLELVAMALAGKHDDVASSLSEVAFAIDRLAQAVEDAGAHDEPRA